MDTIVRPTTTHSEPPPIRHRWVRLLILVSAFTGALAITLGTMWVTNYMPLVQGSVAFGTARTDVRAVQVDAFDMRGTVFTVPTGRNATFHYRFSLSNEGPVAVRIESVGTPSREGPLTRRAVEVIPDPWGSEGPIGYTSEEPWHPFTLSPGGEAVVVMEARYDGRCLDRGDGAAWYWEPLRSPSSGYRGRTSWRSASKSDSAATGVARAASGTSARRRTSSAPPDCRS
ncbi:MAG TPA: hypothetical protein VF195_06860 [Actinomycetota bacterium]